MNNTAMLTSSTVWRRQRARKGARLQGRALWFHSIPHQKIFLTVYPLNCSEANGVTQTNLVWMDATVSGFQSEEILSVALTWTYRWRRPHLYLSERGEEPGSAVQIYSTQDVWVSVLNVGLSGGEGRSVHVSGADVVDAPLLAFPVEKNKKKIYFCFLHPVHLDGIMRRKLQFCTKTSQQWDLKIHLRTSSQSHQ